MYHPLNFNSEKIIKEKKKKISLSSSRDELLSNSDVTRTKKRKEYSWQIFLECSVAVHAGSVSIDEANNE